MPSILSLVVSTIAFFVAAFYMRRWMDAEGIPAGMTRGMMVMIGASVVSWGVAYVVDWLVS